MIENIEAEEELKRLKSNINKRERAASSNIDNIKGFNPQVKRTGSVFHKDKALKHFFGPGGLLRQLSKIPLVKV